MIILGIESATESVGAAIGDGQGAGAALSVTGRRRHAENLAPAICQVLERAGIGLNRVDAIAVDLGPGLFTGLRVGVSDVYKRQGSGPARPSSHRGSRRALGWTAR